MVQWLGLPMQWVQIWSLVGELRFHLPRGQKKKKSKSNIVTNSVNTLKMVHIKKKKKISGVIFCIQVSPSSTSIEAEAERMELEK